MSLLVTFVGGSVGRWRVDRIELVRGEGLPTVDRLDVLEGRDRRPRGSPLWVLRGATSNERYVARTEHDALAAVQAPLGRPEATRAALIPVRKSAAWWDLSQDERRAIFEERSHHVSTGLRYLPAIARRLHHCRELAEPFDLPRLVRVRARACDSVPRARRSPPRERRVGLRRARGGYPPRALTTPGNCPPEAMR